MLLFSLDPDYTAGELLDHLSSWRETGVLYPSVGEGPTLRVLNYPPLTLLMARALATAGLSDLLAGRLSNALGVAALVGTVTWWARARGARGATLAGTVGLLGASFAVLYGAGQFHVETWGAALTVAGFALFDRGAGARAWVAAGVLLGLACFAKQTQVVPALVALAWAWRHRRAAAGPATVALAVTGVLGSAALTAAWGWEPWRHMLTYTVGTFSLANLGFQFLSHAAPWALFLAFAAWTLRRHPASGEPDALRWYWLGSLVWSLSAARVGSGYPYFLDLHVATALLVGPRLFGGAGLGVWRWLLAFQVLAADAGVGVALGTNLARLGRIEAHLPELCRRVEGGEGPGAPLLTEEAGLARACGRPALLHPFIMTSLHDRGIWNASGFEASVAAGRFGPVLLPFDPRDEAGGAHGDRWTSGTLAAFRTAREVEAHPSGYWVLRW